jgi:hypothetical protein
VVRRAPYRLAGEVWGIGFKTADQLARSLGIPHDSPQRVKAGLQLALSQASDDQVAGGPGHLQPELLPGQGTPAEVTVTMVLVSGSHRVAAIRPLAVGRAGHLGRALVVHDQGAGVARFGCACKSRRR